MALEQREPDPCLEKSHHEAHCGLRDVQILARGGEASTSGRGLERAQSIE